MARQRGSNGRFVRGEPGEDGGGKEQVGGRKKRVGAKVAAPRPSACRWFAWARLAKSMPEIAERLVHEAIKGSVPHTKLLVQISGLNQCPVKPAVKKRSKNLEEMLMEAWEKEGAAETGVDPELGPELDAGLE